MHFEKVAEPSPRFPLLEGPESHSPGAFRLGLGTLANPRTLEIYCTLTDPDQGVPFRGRRRASRAAETSET